MLLSAFEPIAKSPLAISMIVAAGFAFVAIWCGVSWTVSKIGGWNRLAEEFPSPGLPSGKRFGVQWGKVGVASYNGFLTIHSSEEGFYLSVWPPFRIGHRTLFIPWDDVHNRETRRVFWSETVAFDVGSPGIAALELPRRIFHEYDLRAWRPGGRALVNCADD